MSQAAKSNQDLDLTGKVAAISGGTQGIGEAVAFRFAKAGSSVYVLGRSQERGSKIVEELKKEAKAGQNFEFVQADLSTVKGIKAAAETLKAKSGSHGIDYLVETQGGPPNGADTKTADGIDRHFAVQILSRFGLAYLLAKSNTLKDSLTVVCAPGGTSSPAPDVDDLQLANARASGKLSWGRAIPATGARDTAVTDGWTAHFAELFPHLRVSHLFPGYVSTKAAANSGFPWPVIALQRLADPVLTRTIGNTATGYAEVPVFAAANPEARRLPGSEWLGPKLNSYGRPKWVDEEKDKRVAVWDQLKALLGEN